MPTTFYYRLQSIEQKKISTLPINVIANIIEIGTFYFLKSKIDFHVTMKNKKTT